ncbi:MAG: TenA family transcriptional regulator [Pseudomonadales bacterium]
MDGFARLILKQDEGNSKLKNGIEPQSGNRVEIIQAITGGSVWDKWLSAEALNRLVSHELLITMADGRVSLSAMRFFLVQHHYYARNFTRFICSIISHLESLGDIQLLMENMQEEMGVDDDDKVTHADLFQRSLQRLGTYAMAAPPLPQTLDFTQSIMTFCRNENPVVGIAALCLGAEAIVPLIYKPILTALKKLEVHEDGLEFFRLHIDEDEGHAITLLGILERLTRQSPEAKALAVQTGYEAITKRCVMFDAIWEDISRQQHA